MIRKLFWLSVFCLAGAAFADKAIGNFIKVRTDTWTVANNLATNAAALTATSGIDVNPGGAVAAVVCAEATRTISSGTLRAYVLMPATETNPDGGFQPFQTWIPYPALDWTPSTGDRCAASGDKQSFVGMVRLAYVEDNVAVSAGTTVTVTYTRRVGQPSVNQ